MKEMGQYFPNGKELIKLYKCVDFLSTHFWQHSDHSILKALFLNFVAFIR
jgi:hypothetical protein